MGGRIEDWHDMSAWNLLCSSCHLGYVEKQPAEAVLWGWKVPRWQPSYLAPVRLYWGWAFLTPSGGYATPPVPSALAAGWPGFPG